MRIREAIEQLKKANPEDDIILVYWERDAFPDVTSEEWPYACDVAESKMDWSRTHEDIQLTLESRGIPESPTPSSEE